MQKFKFVFSILLLVILVLVGAACKKDSKDEKAKEKISIPFQGKITAKQITNNNLGDYFPVISGDGQTIVFWRDTNGDNYQDSLVVAGPNGEEKKVIKIKGEIFDDKFGIDRFTLDISRNGNKVAFVGCPYVENWWSVNPMPEYVYVIDLDKETAAKIDPQELPERIYPKEYDAERADAAYVALNDDGSLVAFTVDVWGVDFGEIHDVIDDDMVLIASADGSSEPSVLAKGIANSHIDMDSQNRVFYVKTDNKDHNKFELSVINADGTGNRGLGMNVSYSGYKGISVSKDGKVAGLLRDEGNVVFVCDANGNILGKGDMSGPVRITGDGSRVLTYFETSRKEANEQGLVFYNIDNNFSVEQVLKVKEYGISSPYFDVNDSGGIIAFIATSYYNSELKSDEIFTITWK